MTNIDNTLDEVPWASLAEDDASRSGPPISVRRDEGVRPPPQESAAPQPDPELAARIAQAQAGTLKNVAAASYLTASTQAFGVGIVPDAFIRYRDQLLADCGNPTDPIEVMLTEQIALAHHAVGRLHVKSSFAKSALEATAYSAAAAKLLTEFRRCVMALDELRSRAASRAHAADQVGSMAQVNGTPSANGVAGFNGSNGDHRLNGQAGPGGPGTREKQQAVQSEHQRQAPPERPRRDGCGASERRKEERGELKTKQWHHSKMHPRSNESPNPRRVAANRRNWLKRKGLTPEGVERLRQAAIKNKPWQHATGPRTPQGKAKVARNLRPARREGKSQRQVLRELGGVKDLLASLAVCRRLAHSEE